MYFRYPILFLLIPLALVILLFDRVSSYPMRWTDHYTYEQEDFSSFVVRLTDPVSQTEKTVRVIGEVVQINRDTGAHPVSGRILLYLRKDSLALGLSYGDLIYVGTKPREFQASQKGEFDARSYFRHKRIYRQAFVAEHQWAKVGQGYGKWWYVQSYALKQKIMSYFRVLFPSGENAGLLSALFLNDKQTLDQSLLQSYRQIGLAHILCVSGLHVGMVSVAVGFFLGIGLRGSLFRRRLKAILVVFSTIIFCFIVGWHPAVCRAALMFSFATLGPILGRNTNSVNNLFVAAFVLLLIEPLWLFDLGFQLSFLSVFGIFKLSPFFLSFYRGKKFIFRWINSCLAVSLSAQLFTLPLCIYYFHQLPTLFLLSNLLILPIVYWLIISILIALLLSPFQVLFPVFRFVLDMELSAMNFIAKTIHNIPGSSIDNCNISATGVWLIYGGIFLLLFTFPWMKTLLRKWKSHLAIRRSR